MTKQLFVTGIGTGIGKTMLSAILTECLQADYWKPIQSGDLEVSDSKFIEKHTSESIVIHPEKYRLQLAASPHKSAREEEVEIKLNDFSIPQTENHLIVEGAGGVFVPINEKEFMIDLIQKFNLPVVVVASDYLGCINHTLLTIESLINRGLQVEYFVFNGHFDEDTQRVIFNHLPKETTSLYIPNLDSITKEIIQKIAEEIRKDIN